MNKLPLALIYLRLIIGFTIIFLSISHVENYKFIAVILFAIGLLTDIFDGIIARRLNISTQTLRRLYSATNRFFLFPLQSLHTFNARDFLKTILLN